MNPSHNRQTYLPWSAVAVVFLLLFVYLPLSFMMGQVRFSAGLAYLTLKYAVDPLIYFGFYAFFVHVFLIWPTTSLALKQWEKIPTRSLRVLVLTLLLSPPLISYAYFRGGVKDLMDLHDLFLAVIPPALVVSLLFEATRRVTLVSLFLSAATYLPLYVLSDVLSPMNTLFTYAPQGSTFYVLRSITPLLSIGATLFFIRLSQHQKEAPPQAILSVSVGLMALGVYGVLVSYGLPLAAAVWLQKNLGTYLFAESGAWLCIGIAILMIRGGAHAHKLSLAGAALGVAISLVGIARFAMTPEMSFWEISRFTYAICTLVTCAWMIVYLLRPSMRILLRAKYPVFEG